MFPRSSSVIVIVDALRLLKEPLSLMSVGEESPNTVLYNPSGFGVHEQFLTGTERKGIVKIHRDALDVL